MRGLATRTRAAWLLFVAALGVLAGLSLSRPAAASGVCFPLAGQVGALTAGGWGRVDAQPSPEISAGTLDTRDHEARPLDSSQSPWAQRAAGRDPRTSQGSTGTQRQDMGGFAAPHPGLRGWGLSPFRTSARPVVEGVQPTARTSDARSGALLRGIHATRGPPANPLS